MINLWNPNQDLVYNGLGFFFFLPVCQDIDHQIQNKFMPLEYDNKNFWRSLISLLEAQFHITLMIQHTWTRYPLDDPQTYCVYIDITEVI